MENKTVTINGNEVPIRVSPFTVRDKLMIEMRLAAYLELVGMLMMPPVTAKQIFDVNDEPAITVARALAKVQFILMDKLFPNDILALPESTIANILKTYNEAIGAQFSKEQIKKKSIRTLPSDEPS